METEGSLDIRRREERDERGAEGDRWGEGMDGEREGGKEGGSSSGL